jgi:hypothetical protein
MSPAGGIKIENEEVQYQAIVIIGYLLPSYRNVTRFEFF